MTALFLSQMKSRFENLNEVFNNFNFLTGSSLKLLTSKQLRTFAMNLAIIYQHDLDKTEFASEIASFKYQANSLLSDLATASQLDLLQLIHTYCLQDASTQNVKLLFDFLLSYQLLVLHVNEF